MVNTGSFLTFLGILASAFASEVTAEARKPDPCAKVGGQKWVAPNDLRACFSSVKVDPAIKENIIEVINKTLAFHTSVNYEISAPEPFTPFVHEDLLKDLARISAQSYNSDYDLHIDLSRTLKRLNDGHCVWINSCYDSLFLNFLPVPLVLLTDASGTQSVHIAPEAFNVSSVEFPDQIDVWEHALPKGITLESLNGATVLTLNGDDPFVAVDANALITGSFQGLGTRQNAFFSSYQLGATTWNYIMGNFAQQSLPLSDHVTLEVQRVGQRKTDTITLPYRARIGTATVNFTDTASWRAGNCLADPAVNGIVSSASSRTSKTTLKYMQQPSTSASSSSKQHLNVMLDTTPLSNVVLPPELTPASPPLNGSFGVGQFFMLDDGITGVLALGSFSGADFDVMQNGLLEGLVGLKSRGATQLVVDVSNNGGGFICVAHFLHRIIAGPKGTTEPQSGLDTEARVGPLAKLIVRQILDKNTDPNMVSLYNPVQWTNASSVPFAANFDWLDPSVDLTINGHRDSFSQRVGEECLGNGGFVTPPPDEPLFDGSKVVIISNGRCASSCSLFSITMAKKEGSKTVVLGGKKGVKQEYCGTVGGQSTDFSTIDFEVQLAGLKSNSLAPPDLLVKGVQGITWRFGFGVDDPTQPEEWQDHPADLNLPLTPALVNNPVAIWTEVTRRLLSDSS